MMATYYSDTFTSDLRWAILVAVCLCVLSVLFVLLVAVLAMRPAKSLEQRRMLSWHLLPQDQSVRLTEMPYDWAEGEQAP